MKKERREKLAAEVEKFYKDEAVVSVQYPHSPHPRCHNFGYYVQACTGTGTIQIDH